MTMFFWPQTLDPNVASYRLRCQRVMENLINQGLDIKLFDIKLLDIKLLFI